MKTNILNGEYVSLRLIEKKLSVLIYNFREQVLSTPGIVADSVAQVCGGDRILIYNIIDERLREMLTELADGKERAVAEVQPTQKTRRQRAAEIEEELLA